MRIYKEKEIMILQQVMAAAALVIVLIMMFIFIAVFDKVSDEAAEKRMAAREKYETFVEKQPIVP